MLQARTLEDVDEALGDFGVDAFDAEVVVGIEGSESHDEIGFGGIDAVRILESVWAFDRYKTHAEGLKNYFKQFIDANDGLFVAEFSDWASYNTDGQPSKL